MNILYMYAGNLCAISSLTLCSTLFPVRYFVTNFSILWQDDMVPFFEVLSLCHTVQIEQKTPANGNMSLYDVVDGVGEVYEYNASSPDEKALVEACRKYVSFVYVMI